MGKKRNLKERICAVVLAFAMSLSGILPNVGTVVQAADVDAYFFVYEEDAADTANKIPIKGVELTIGGQKYTTDENGKCQAANVAEGTEIIVDRTGYESLTTNPTVQSGTTEDTPQEIKLTMKEISFADGVIILQTGKTGSVAFAEGTEITDANSLAYSWSVVSGTENAAIDSATGVITANHRGTATIQVERNDKTAQKEITIKDKFDMTITATPAVRGSDNSTVVIVEVNGIPEDAGNVTVSANGTTDLGTNTVTASSNTTTFTIPEGKQDIVFSASYAEDANYLATSVSTDICTYKKNQPISVKSDFDTSYEYGDGTIDLAAAIEGVGDRSIGFKLDNDEVLSITENNTLEIIGAGTVKVTINAAENDTYTEASTSCTIEVSKKDLGAIGVEDIVWSPVTRAYDGTNEVTLTGALPENTLVDGDTVTISAKATITGADAGEYTTFDYVSAETPDNNKYEFTLDETNKTGLSISDNGKITITPRNLYVQVEEGTSVSMEYGSTNAEIETALQGNDEIQLVLVDETGALDSDADSGLVEGENVDISNAAEVVLKDQTYYVGTYSDAIQPSITNGNLGNYKLVVGDSIEEYSGKLNITEKVVTDILSFLNIEDGQDNVYIDGTKIWVRSNTELAVKSAADEYTDVYLKRGEGAYQENEISLIADQEGNLDVTDISVYLSNKNDITNKTRTTAEEGAVTDNIIPAGTVSIDNKLPEVQFSTLELFGNAYKLESNLLYKKFSGEEYTETITISDDGSGLSKDENGNETYDFKIVPIEVGTSETNEAIRSAAADETGWTGKTSNYGTSAISVPASEEGFYVVLVKVKDNVGNEAVYSSNGLVIDTTKPSISITGIDANKAYNTDIKYTITAEDSLSKIDKVVVEVLDRDGNAIEGSAAGENSFTVENIVGNDLTKEALEGIEDKYTIDATILKEVSGIGTTIKATAYDKAGNPSATAEQGINVDTTPPSATYSYDNNESAEVEGIHYFTGNRIMTITYTERNFDPSKAGFRINVDGKEYTTNLGSWNEELDAAGVKLISGPDDSQAGEDVYTDERTITYKIEFGAEAEEHEYEILEMTVEDLADNSGTVSPVDGTVAATEFIIDRKPSEITMEYDLKDADAENVTFFKAERTLTITYTETYFNTKNVKLTLKSEDEKTLAEWLTAKEDGIKVAESSTEGDDHVYTVTFGGDGLDLDFDVSTSMTDFAGNDNAEIVYADGEAVEKTCESFTVDMVDPEVTISLNDGAVNTSYYKEDAIATVTFTERNFYEDGLSFDVAVGAGACETYSLEELKKLEGITVEEGSSSEDNTYVYEITFDGGEDSDQDYKITPHITDKAGNTEAKTPEESSFTVDKIAPTLEVEYYIVDGERTNTTATTSEKDRLYTNKKVEAVVTITERNFSLFEQFSTDPDQMAVSFHENGVSIENSVLSAKDSLKWKPTGETDEWQQTFEFDVPERTGDSDFDFQITYTDLADNQVESETYYLTVDKVAPVVDVTYYEDVDETSLIADEDVDFMDSGERLYRRDAVYAKYQITERNFVREPNSGAFDDGQMSAGYETTKNVDTPVDYQNLAENASNWNYDSNKVIADQTFNFVTQANYTIGMTYKDLAGNEAVYADHQFTIDWTAPTGEITIPDSAVSKGGTWSSGEDTEYDGIWSKLVKIIYSFFTGSEHKITMESDDVTAGVAGTYYYIDKTATGKKETECLSEAELDKLENWSSYDDKAGITAELNTQSALYEKIVDKSGNVTYLNAEYGVIVDNVDPTVELTDLSPTRNGIHYGDVTIQVNVTDPKVDGVYAGIDRVEYSIESTTNVIASESGTVAMTYKESSDERAQSGMGQITVDAQKFNSNDVTVTVTAYDNADNSFTKDIKLKIDVTKPVVEDITWNTSAASNGKYYNVTRVATITVRERNFDPSQVRLNITNTDGTRAEVSGWTVNSSGTSDDNVNTCTVTFSADGDYNMNMSCTDLAGNVSNTVTIEEFTIDKTVPTINVTFDNNNAANGKYYNASRTATITVNEHNFNGSEVQTAITSNTVTPGVNGWSNSGDVHAATVAFTADGNYSFTVNYTDLAGNAAQVYNVDEFVIDQTKPEIEIFDIEDKSANNGEVAPGVRYSDTNYDVSGVSITYSGAKHDVKAVDGARTSIPNGESIKMADFEHTEETDDVYTMTAKVTDLAGNYDEKEVTFSVNRFGSNFIFSEETEEFLDDYYNNEEETLVVTEINVDTLTHRGITCGHDGDLTDFTEGTDYTVKESGSEVSWKSYEYTIKKDNFEKEGVYNITIDSVDRATNQVNNKIKEADIEFVIDKTAPTVVITGIEDDGQYRTNTRDITIAASDNVAMSRVEVYVDDEKKPAESFNANTIQRQNGELPYTLTSSSDWQEIKAVAVDMAGNVADTSKLEGSDKEQWISVLVTSNLFVQFYRNTPLVIGTVIVVICLAGFFFLILAKRRKKDEEEEAVK